MGLNVTNVFIRTTYDALADNMWKLTEDEREELCDKLVALCEEYAPGIFEKSKEEPKKKSKKSKKKTREDLSEMLDDMLDND